MSRSADGSSCDAVLELLEAFVDGDLGPAEERTVADHLDGCRACRREHDLTLEIRSTLRSLPQYDAPAKLLWSVRMAARETGSEVGLRTRLMGWVRQPVAALAAASLAFVLVIAAIVWWQRPAPRPSLDDPEIARAAQGTRFALALVGELGRRAALDEVLGRRVVSPTVDGLNDALRRHLDSHKPEHEKPAPGVAADKGGASG